MYIFFSLFVCFIINVKLTNTACMFCSNQQQLGNLKKTNDGHYMFHIYNGLLNMQGVDLLVPWAEITMRWEDDNNNDINNNDM
jgi:hypothetical protein